MIFFTICKFKMYDLQIQDFFYDVQKFLNLCSGPLLPMVSVSFPGKPQKYLLCLSCSPQGAGSPCGLHHIPFSVCASDSSGVSPRCCLHSSLQQRATERVFWRPGLIYQVLETLTEVAMPLCHPAPLLSRRLPLPFPSP